VCLDSKVSDIEGQNRSVYASIEVLWKARMCVKARNIATGRVLEPHRQCYGMPRVVILGFSYSPCRGPKPYVGTPHYGIETQTGAPEIPILCNCEERSAI